MNIEILLGKTREHLVPLEGTKHFVHKQMLGDLLRLQRDALKDGFDLQVASAFRDFDRQLRIWNSKALGERPVTDDRGLQISFDGFTDTDKVFAILRWSALPGSSRHHWGSDVDVYDGNTQKEEEVLLRPSECEGNGPAAKLHEWLDDKIANNEAHGFFRPYKNDNGGIAPERWHLSYFPIARRMLDNYTFSIFRRSIEESTMQLKSSLLSHADEIFHRFVLNIDLP